MKCKLYIIITVVISLVYSCKKPVDVEAEKKAILLLHNEQRRAHFEKNVSLLLGDGDTDLIEVNHGNINRPSKEKIQQKFQAYFDAVDFIKWDDISPPVFNFSADATMATTIAEKLVITRQKNESSRLDTAQFAWLAVYKKNNGKWRMEQIASTNK